MNATSNEEHSIIENDMTVDENYNQDQAEPMILEATEIEGVRERRTGQRRSV